MLGEKIQNRMTELGISQAELCRRSGLASNHVSYLVRGVRGRRPGPETVAKLCKGLGVGPDFFYKDYSHMRVRRARA